MTTTQTPTASTKRVVVNTEDGKQCGQGEIRNTPSETFVTLELVVPGRPDKVDEAEADNSPNGASNSPSSRADAETSASIPLSEPEASRSDNEANIDSSDSSEPGNNAIGTKPPSDVTEREQSTDSETPANEASSPSTSEPDPETHGADETESTTSSKGASSDDLGQDNPSESSDTPSSLTPLSAPSAAETPEPSKTETETEESSEDSKESPGTVNNEYIPTSTQNQEALESWINARQQGQAQTPDKSIKQIELVSWLQVPEILRALSKNEGPLRITYPDCSDTKITAEQQAIRKFLVEGAGEGLKDLTGKLEEKIKNCHFVTNNIVAKEVAQAYLTSIPLDNSSSTKLTVAEVIRTNEHFTPTKQGKPRMTKGSQGAIKGRDLILEAITSTMQASTEFHTFIIEVPEIHRKVAEMTFAQHYNSLEPKPNANNTKVWVMSSSDPLQIEEIDFLKFIEDAPELPKSKERKSQRRKSDSSEGSLQDQVLS